MIIAVNTNFTSGGFLNAGYDFIFECFSRLAQQYPQHQFIYLVDKGFTEKNITAKNITAIVAAGSQSKNPLLFQYWLNYKLPLLLRKHKVDVFISANCCSLRTKVPQCIIINDLSFLQHPQYFKKNWLRFYKNNTASFLGKAKNIVTVSQFLKQEITGQYKIQSDKIDVAYPGTNSIFKPVSWQIKDAVKEKYTEGLEYFLYSGAIHPQQNLITLLKAFSFFKKRQKSNMQLIIASTTVATDKEFVKSLSTFKYRHEVKILEKTTPELLAQITASAYALVYPSPYDGFGVSPAQAMQCDVPVITSHINALTETCGDAALYINPNDFNNIAEKMMLLFKDEDQRNQLIIKGRQQAGLFNCDKTAAVVWEVINKCAN
jgi:glycosyltransferase involved in cell wall biosynthesis